MIEKKKKDSEIFEITVGMSYNHEYTLPVVLIP